MPQIMVDPQRCMACRACEVACGINRDSVSRSVAGAFREEVLPTPRVVVQGNAALSLPVQCRHCEEAICLDSCPSGALYRAPEDGRVLFDDNRCIGCWMCVAVCPFGAIKPSAAGKVAIKCDACYGMERPFCVEACPTNALAYVDVAAMRQLAKRKSGQIVETLYSDLNPAVHGRDGDPIISPAVHGRDQDPAVNPRVHSRDQEHAPIYLQLGYSTGRGGRS